ncbi:MAG: DUF6600 domain-containing protein [Ramlibacter sp.]
MTLPSLRRLLAPLICAFLTLGLSGIALADPPSRVARLSYLGGNASFSPGGERDWGRATINRPLVTGDRLWVERGARAELQLGAAAIRVSGSTSLTLLNLDDRTVQVELAQGTLNIRVRKLDRGQVFEIDTPNLAFSIRRPGSYRIEVDPDGEATAVTVRSGQAEVYGEGRAFITAERRSYRFYGSGLRDYETLALLRSDDFDRWTTERDRRWDDSPSRRYVSAELIGYANLDQYGTWRKVPEYGFVWTPRRVSADWAPYRDGHWAWVEPWGWTWVDEAQWGFATSHYGRWAYVDRSWAWVPGPATARPVYAPALVAFVGGGSSGGAGNRTVGWFPLGPHDVYRPSYTASREYFNSVNTSNAVIDRTVVTNLYNNTGANVTYANQQIPGALVAVLAAAFSQSRPVARETVRMSQEAVQSARAIAVAPVAPVQASVVGPTAAPAGARPPERAQARPVVAQVAPPAPPPPFSARQGALAANPGMPLDAAALLALRPAAAAAGPAPTVKVVQAAPPVALPPGGRASGPGQAAPPVAPPAPPFVTGASPAAPPPKTFQTGPGLQSPPPAPSRGQLPEATPPAPRSQPPQAAQPAPPPMAVPGPRSAAPSPAAAPPSAAPPGARPAAPEAASPPPRAEAPRPPVVAPPGPPTVPLPPAPATRATPPPAPAAVPRVAPAPVPPVAPVPPPVVPVPPPVLAPPPARVTPPAPAALPALPVAPAARTAPAVANPPGPPAVLPIPAAPATPPASRPTPPVTPPVVGMPAALPDAAQQRGPGARPGEGRAQGRREPASEAKPEDRRKP